MRVQGGRTGKLTPGGRSMDKRLYLVRHGDTAWTRSRRLQGQTDVPLSCEGRQQAQEVARHLADVRFDSAYSSDLSRALETAQAILAMQSSPVSLSIESALREISDGIYEGWSKDAVGSEPRILQTSNGPTPVLDCALPGGESIRQVFSRQQEAAPQIMADRAGRHILVVGHDWALRLLAVALVGGSPESFPEFESLRPASVSIIEISEGSASIALWNQTRHLSLGPHPV